MVGTQASRLPHLGVEKVGQRPSDFRVRKRGYTGILLRVETRFWREKTPPFVELHIVSAGNDGLGRGGNFREGFAENVLTLPGCGCSEPENWISQKAPPALGEAD